MWKFEHSVECRVNRDSAWKFWTNVDNWPVVDPSVESVKINGSFVAGTQGTTKPRDHDTVEWRLTEVEPPRRAHIEIPAPGATLICAWMFEDAPNGGTRITQQARLEGEQAEHYAGTVGPELEAGIPQAMRRLAEAMDRVAGEKMCD